MGNGKKNDKITVANIVSVSGVVLLLIFSFLGHSYMSGGEIGLDIVISVSITAFSSFLLWFLIKAKGAENQTDKWRIIEYVTLGVYVLFAIVASWKGGIMHFFVVNDNKETIKRYAQTDVNKIDSLISEYEEFEGAAITNTCMGLENAVRRNQRADASLNAFFSDNVIAHDLTGVNIFRERQEDDLVGDNFIVYKDAVHIVEKDFLNMVNSWSIMEIPFKAKMIEELAISVGEQLTIRSEGAILPEIKYSAGVYTIVSSNQCRNFGVDAETLQFRQALKNVTGFSVKALLIVLLIHFLILFNYIFAYRSRSLEISKVSEDDGGIIL